MCKDGTQDGDRFNLMKCKWLLRSATLKGISRYCYTEQHCLTDRVTQKRQQQK